MSRSAGIVVAGHPLTAEAGAEVLRAGGNAFDAIVAAAWAACVAEPVLASPGGGGFLLARPLGAAAETYDFFVQTPRVRRPLEELDFHPIDVDFGTLRQTFHVGVGSTATPGMVGGLFEIRERLGTLPMSELVAPAVALARDGVEVNAFQALIMRLVGPILLDDAASRALFSPRGSTTYGEGELQRKPQLADTFEALAREGDALFYRGDLARCIADFSAQRGGHLTRDDLEAYRVCRREPLALDYRGVRVVTNPPPSAGGLLVAFGLQLLAGSTPAQRGFGSTGHLAALARTMALTDMARVDSLSDESHALEAQQLLDPPLLERYRDDVRDRARSVRGTTHINAIDAAGNVASMTLSNGATSGRVAPGTGFVLNDMLGEQDLNPQGFQRFPLDQRLSSMMAPTLTLFADGRVAAIGSGGSNRIRTAILQVLVNLIDHGMSLQRAVEAPRLFVENEVLSVEPGFDGAAVDRVAADYPEHHRWDEQSLYFGGVNTAERGADGALDGAGDPRRGGCSVSA